ncbi:MAG: cohesin domain-containing protein [bacterium]|nr:cohesin domain-containing protein [bacterium]
MKKVLFILLSISFLFPHHLFAAEIFYDADTRKVKANTEFEIGVFLNAESENINAIEGILRFPADILEFKELSDGNSIINFWVERPTLRAQNEIFFSGITPGGFIGKRGLIFRITFLAKEEGIGKVAMQSIKALRNDGSGSEVGISASPLEVAVTAQALPLPPKKIKDEEPPESFKPEIARDPTLFGGKWFLVFATQDKGSGIDRYEIKETRHRILGSFSRWISAESPHALRDQKLRSYIFVKAIDKAGNIRTEKIPPQNLLRWYENYENWIIIIIGFAIVYAMRKFLWKKYSK